MSCGRFIRISGGDGDDYLDGDRDSDVLKGGAGNDTLLGNMYGLNVQAVDFLFGQSGFDTAIVSQFSHDRLSDIERPFVL